MFDTETATYQKTFTGGEKMAHKLTNGIRCEALRITSRHWTDGCYRGRIAVYEDGKRLYTITSIFFCISRGDALDDARHMATSLILIGS